MTLMNARGYQAYQKNKYDTASPHKLIALLYDAAATNIERALKAIDQNMGQDASQFILKAQDIVSELMACLNLEQGGEIANNLKDLYFYMIKQLVQANIRKDKEILLEVSGYILSLREAWQQIGKEVGISAGY